MDVLCTFKIKIESPNLDHWCTKDSYHIQIKIKIPNPSQEPPASSKVPNQDFKDMDILCTFKIKIESHKSKILSKTTSDHIQVMIKMPNPSQDLSASSAAQNHDFKDIDILCTFKIKIESQNLEHGYTEDH